VNSLGTNFVRVNSLGFNLGTNLLQTIILPIYNMPGKNKNNKCKNAFEIVSS